MTVLPHPPRLPCPLLSLRLCLKGVTLFQNGDAIASKCTLGSILDEVQKNKTPPQGMTSALSFAVPVLNVLGSICFVNKDFEGALERFTQSFSFKNALPSPRQKASTLCNMASAYYKMRNYKESEQKYKQALKVSESLDETSLKATITCKLAYIVYRQKKYQRAHKLFSDGKNLACNSVNVGIAFEKNQTSFILVLLHSHVQSCIERKPWQRA